MKLKSQNILFFIIVLALTVGAFPVWTQEGVWTIGPRTLPPSVDVSDEFRETLLSAPKPDVEAAKSNAPETIEQWEAMIRAADEKTAAAARKMAEASPHT